MWPITRIPENWQACDGSLLQISQYQVLFALIGNTYGGDGVSTFAVPDLRGRVPLHNGQLGGAASATNYVRGMTGGTEQVTLTPAQMPSHNHTMNASTTVASIMTATPASVLGAISSGSPALPTDTLYGSNQNDATKVPPYKVVPLAPQTVANAGGNGAHPNVMPFTCINYIICFNGIWPAQ